MSFNPGKNKQAQKIVFSRNKSKSKHPQLLFNTAPVAYSFLSKGPWDNFR